jgi:uncharacterized lipoprotein NlpE involved in copper resistance
MKKILIALFALPLFFGSCKDDKATPSVEQQEQGTLPNAEALDSVAPAETDTIKADTVAAATDAWYGNYSGSLPCGDCKGILTRITFDKDKKYTMSSQYLGKEKPIIYKGTYDFDSPKRIATLDAEGDHLKFLVVEKDSMVIKLDKFGNREKGAPYARYFLHKVM